VAVKIEKMLILVKNVERSFGYLKRNIMNILERKQRKKRNRRKAI